MALFPDGVALVFGGTGGAGRGVVSELVKAGTDVAFTYNSKKNVADELIAELAPLGRKVTAHQVTIGDAARVNQVVEDVIAEYGRIHTAVVGVGTFADQRKIADAKDEWKTVLNEDVNGFLNVLYATLPHFRENRGGSYVHLGSAGDLWWPEADGLSVVPKASIEALIRGIAKEEGRYGIRANSVLLGVIEAGMFKAQLDRGVFQQNWIDSVNKVLCIKRWGQPEEIGHAVTFLASNKAGYITGHRLPVAGGFGVGGMELD